MWFRTSYHHFIGIPLLNPNGVFPSVLFHRILIATTRNSFSFPASFNTKRSSNTFHLDFATAFLRPRRPRAPGPHEPHEGHRNHCRHRRPCLASLSKSLATFTFRLTASYLLVPLEAGGGGFYSYTRISQVRFLVSPFLVCVSPP